MIHCDPRSCRGCSLICSRPALPNGHSRALTQNQHFNGHPDLLVKGAYPKDAAQAGVKGIEIKTTRKAGGAVDTHGAREQWMTVFVYAIDGQTEPARDRRPLRFTEVYLGHVTIADFRKNARGELGTRTATLHRDGILKATTKLGVPRFKHVTPRAEGSPHAQSGNTRHRVQCRCFRIRSLEPPRGSNRCRQTDRAPSLPPRGARPARPDA